MYLRFAPPSTKLGSLEIGLRLLHGAGGIRYLKKHVGRRRALEYLLSASTVDAERAEHISWINKSFPSVAEMNDCVDKPAERIATFPATAIEATKAFVNEQASTNETGGVWKVLCSRVVK